MKRGFTLIELLIAIVIIGIILAIAIPKITETLDRSHENSTRANLGSLKTAISMYYGDYEEWPRGDIDGDNNPSGAMDGDDLVRAIVPHYIDKIPPCMLRRGVANDYSTITYTNQMPSSCGNHGESCMGGTGCPKYGTITNDGGWWYHVGSHTLRINSQERDSVGVFYSSYE